MGAAVVIGVLALQGDVREHLRALDAAGVTARSVRRPAELEAVDGLVIPGGESTTMSRLAIDFGVLEPLQKLVGAGLPAFGSCAGMIMLAAEVLDGRDDQQCLAGIDMTVRRNAFGRQVESFEADVDLVNVPVEPDRPDGPFHAVFIRAPWVERVGEGVEVLGRVRHGTASPGAPGAPRAATPGDAGPAGSAGRPSDAGRIVAVRQRNVLATAFHPELTGDLRVHRLFVDMVRGADHFDARTRGEQREV